MFYRSSVQHTRNTAWRHTAKSHAVRLVFDRFKFLAYCCASLDHGSRQCFCIFFVAAKKRMNPKPKILLVQPFHRDIYKHLFGMSNGRHSDNGLNDIEIAIATTTHKGCRPNSALTFKGLCREKSYFRFDFWGLISNDRQCFVQEICPWFFSSDAIYIQFPQVFHRLCNVPVNIHNSKKLGIFWGTTMFICASFTILTLQRPHWVFSKIVSSTAWWVDTSGVEVRMCLQRHWYDG